MKNKLPPLHTTTLAASLTIAITSCKLGTTTTQKTTQPTTHTKIDSTAHIINAKYGTNYQIYGNTIAKFPHFNLSHFSQQPIPSSKDAIHTFEITSKDGFAKTHITSDTSKPQRKHFSLEGLHFYYHSNTPGYINIYMPPQLLAQQHPQQ